MFCFSSCSQCDSKDCSVYNALFGVERYDTLLKGRCFSWSDISVFPLFFRVSALDLGRVWARFFARELRRKGYPDRGTTGSSVVTSLPSALRSALRSRLVRPTSAGGGKREIERERAGVRGVCTSHLQGGKGAEDGAQVPRCTGHPFALAREQVHCHGMMLLDF